MVVCDLVFNYVVRVCHAGRMHVLFVWRLDSGDCLVHMMKCLSCSNVVLLGVSCWWFMGGGGMGRVAKVFVQS